MNRARRRGYISPVGRLVDSQLASLQFSAKIREHMAPLVWAEVVGPQVAAATEVIKVSAGVLYVSTRSSVWSSELTFYKADILKRLNARLGAASAPVVLDIRFQNHGVTPHKADDSVPHAPNPDELDDVSLSESEMRTAEEGVAHIQDPDLRESVRRARLADMKVRTWRLDNGWVPCPSCGDLMRPSGPAGDDSPPERCPACRR